MTPAAVPAVLLLEALAHYPPEFLRRAEMVCAADIASSATPKVYDCSPTQRHASFSLIHFDILAFLAILALRFDPPSFVGCGYAALGRTVILDDEYENEYENEYEYGRRGSRGRSCTPGGPPAVSVSSSLTPSGLSLDYPILVLMQVFS